MSYAAAAAKGPKQTAEEARAPAPPQVEHTDISSTSSLIDVDSASVHTVPSDFSSQPVQTETQLHRLEQEAIAAETRAKEEAKKAAAKGKKEAKKVKNTLEANSDNPVFIGNAIAVVALSGALGFHSYRKYAAGELTWKVIGAYTAAVGLFATADYYLSSYLFKNKYPKK